MSNKMMCKIGAAIVFCGSIFMYTQGYHHWIVILGGCLAALELLEG